MNAKILVVDDDPAISEMLTLVLQAEGFDTVAVADGADAVGAAEAEQPDLILLDLMLPGMTVDVVLGLESGADDYVNKPFKAKELVARIRARLRRTEDEVSDVIELGDLTIDVAGHQVRRGNEEIPLTPLEYELLLLLARKPRQVVSREELLTSIWGYRSASDSRVVNVHVQRLRAKIEKDPENPQIIVTVRGVGYKTGCGE